jgi:hypothetical protein
MHAEAFDVSEIAKKDHDGRNAFHVAVEVKSSDAVVTFVLNHLLPIRGTSDNIEIVDASFHGDAWFKAVQMDRYEAAVAEILARNSAIEEALARALDHDGRRAVDIASTKNKARLQQAMYLFKRYELTTSKTKPHHVSPTCVVHLAVDHSLPEGEDRGVALKFMRQKEQFDREVQVRTSAAFDDAFVITIGRAIDGDVEETREFEAKGFSAYPYLIVMPAGDRSLADVVAKENIAGQDYDQIRMAMLQISQAVGHLHAKGYLHGDLKRKL